MSKYQEDIENYLRAGQEALGRTDWIEARSNFEAALEKNESPEALEFLGLAAWWLDDASTTFETREKAYRLYRQKGNAQSAARVAIALAFDYHSFRGEYIISNGWSRRAHRLLKNLDPVPEHGWLKAWDGNVAIEVDHDPVRALQLGNETVLLSKQLNDFDLEMMGISLEGLALVCAGNVDEGMQRLDEAATAAMAGEISDLEISITVCCYLISACERVQDYNRAVQWCYNVKGAAANGTYPLMFSLCQVHYAGVLLWHGDWDEAEKLLEEASVKLIATRPGHAAEGIVLRADLHRLRGRFEEAAELLNQANEKPFRMMGANRVLLSKAALAYDQNEVQVAANLAERYIRNIPDACQLILPSGLKLLTLAQVSLGKLTEAATTALQLRSIAEHVGTEPLYASADFTEGMVLLEKADYKSAKVHFEQSIELFEQNKNPFETARARCGLARALHSLGQKKIAIQEINLALEAFEQLNAFTEINRAKNYLKKLQTTETSRSADSSPDAFTKRELEIVCEIATGKDNSQIASDLFISIRTVERHISNIYGKLGISGKSARAYVTNFAHRNDLIE